MTRKAYTTDLSDREWQLIEPLLPGPKPLGRTNEHPRREILNAIFYLNRNGCTWRNLPGDFPAYGTVSHYYHTWRRSGVFQTINDARRTQLRMAEGRHPSRVRPVWIAKVSRRPRWQVSEAMMRAKKSKVASATSLWIPWDWYCSSSFTPPRFKIEIGPSWSMKRCQDPSIVSLVFGLTALTLVNSLSGSKRSATASSKLSSAPTRSQGFGCFRGAGWWRRPNHNTPETLPLTEPTPRPMLGISGLLQLLTWVEHRRAVQTSEHEEGGVPCPIPHPTRLPPARFQASKQSVGRSAPGQSSAAPLAAESSARTPATTEQCTRQGGRR